MTRSLPEAVKSCNSCHPNGRDWRSPETKKSSILWERSQKSLEEADKCPVIVNANKGKAIDVKSGADEKMVAYIKTLKAKKATSGY